MVDTAGSRATIEDGAAVLEPAPAQNNSEQSAMSTVGSLLDESTNSRAVTDLNEPQKYDISVTNGSTNSMVASSDDFVSPQSSPSPTPSVAQSPSPCQTPSAVVSAENTSDKSIVCVTSDLNGDVCLKVGSATRTTVSSNGSAETISYQSTTVVGNSYTGLSEQFRSLSFTNKYDLYCPKVVREYHPPPEAIRQETGKKIRKIFGDMPLEDYEIEAEAQMHRQLLENGFPLAGTIFESRHQRLRYLQGNEWDIERCQADMSKHLEWRATHLPVRDEAVSDILPLGYCYIHGRDRYMRPVVVIRCKELQTADRDKAVLCIVYWLEFVIANLLVPNRIEQWRVIIDMADCALYNVPAIILKDVAMTLARNYRGRLHQMTIINAPLIFWGIWQVISLVLPESTRQKISIMAYGFEPEFRKVIHDCQLEEKYGGTCPDVAINYVEPTMPPPPPPEG
eukprot:GHVQ01022139.1.p1 GENE.GHVQ01022139.1~~GHVQ01022139.1.p1  ORF type:complete len:452 (-),score=55.06 GHVQ01022139.1:1481-2836(-)